jgi:hypothetical protein
MSRAATAAPSSRRPRRPLLAPALVTAAAAALAAPAVAQRQTMEVTPALEVSLGWYQPDFESSVRLDSPELGAGTTLDLERDLLVEEDADELRAELGFRLGRRNRIVLDHVSFDRSGANTLGRSIQFGDVLYAGSAELRAHASSEHTGAAWRFSFVDADAVDLAFSLGASLLDVEASLEGEAILTVDGVPVAGAVVSERGEASGPVPLVGLHGRWILMRQLRLVADARYFDIDDFEGWSGSLVDWGVRLDFGLGPNLALGIGWAATDIEADFEETDSLGSIDYAFDGLRASVTVAF